MLNSWAKLSKMGVSLLWPARHWPGRGVPRARSGGRRVQGGSKIKEELNANSIDKARKPQGAPKVRIQLY